MNNDKKSSILKDALTDYNAIKEAADANAKKKLAEEFPDKFNSFFMEELNRNKSKKESYKKLDESKESAKDEIKSNKEESVMKKEEKETKGVEETKVEKTVGDGKPFTEKGKNVEKVEEDVKITNTVGKPDPFTEKAKKSKKIEETAGIDGVFTENPKKSLQTEEFDITELDMQSVGGALEGAEEDDELITMDEIENEIASMEGLGEELKGIKTSSPSYMEKGNKGVAFDQLVDLKKQLDEILQGLGEMHSGGADGDTTYGSDSQIAQQHAQGPTEKLIDEKGLEEMHAAGGKERFGTSSQVSQLHQGNPMIDEEDITDADVEAVLGSQSEETVEETIAMPHPNKRATTATLPGKEYQSQGNVDRMRFAMRESEKKLSTLIEENKKLTKKLNETKKYKQSVTTLVEQYKTALEKYRNQLKEMATFNTNLAHVNNLLVNESLALTQEDKIKIINEFKKVNSIAESQNKYKAILSEMKDSRKTLTESIENKVSASIQPSSMQKLDEVVEKTAYENNEHINRMKKLIEYVEGNRGKKIIK